MEEFSMTLENARKDLMECTSIHLVLACFTTRMLLSKTVLQWQTEAIDLSCATQLFSSIRDLHPVKNTDGNGHHLRLGCRICIWPPGSVIPHITPVSVDRVGVDNGSTALGNELVCVKCIPGVEGRMICKECRGTSEVLLLLARST